MDGRVLLEWFDKFLQMFFFQPQILFFIKKETTNF